MMRIVKEDKDVFIIGLLMALAAIAAISVMTLVFTPQKQSNKEAAAKAESENKIVYDWQEQRKQALIEAGFYPGRMGSERSDYFFDFDAYLEYLGAIDIVKSYHTTENGEVIYILSFVLDGYFWKVKTVEFRQPDQYSWGMFSMITAELQDGGVVFGVPTENSGTHICDTSSPFKIDWDTFNVFHVATDKESILARGLHSKVEESNCPFRGLGVDHYEMWNSEDPVLWHDDEGDTTGVDLHY